MHRAESGEKEMVVKLGNAGAEVHENVSEHSKTAGQSQTHPVQAKIAQGSMRMHRTHARTCTMIELTQRWLQKPQKISVQPHTSKNRLTHLMV